jgi:hypothetical protein
VADGTNGGLARREYATLNVVLECATRTVWVALGQYLAGHAGTRLHAEPRHDDLEMVAHCMCADPQTLGNLFVRRPVRDQECYFGSTLRQTEAADKSFRAHWLRSEPLDAHHY